MGFFLKKKISILAFILLCLVFTNISKVWGIEYGGIGGRPAYPRDDNPRSSSIFIHTVVPGDVINEGVRIINNTSTQKTIYVYAADSVRSTDGGFACKQLSEEAVGVGSWVKLEKNEVTLPSTESEIVPFTITVPKNIDVGEHNGCILMHEIKPAEKKAESGVSLSIRTGIRIALTIPGELIKKLKLDNFVIDASKKVIFFHTSVKNEGNVSLDADVKVLVRGLFNLFLKDYSAQYLVLRNDTAVINYEFVRPLFGGIFWATPSVEYDDGQGITTLKGSPVRFIVLPSLRAIIYVLLALLPVIIVLIIILVKKHRIKKRKGKWTVYIVKEGDNLPEICSRYGLSWQDIAEVNKIKPPYTLHKGDKIHIPPTTLWK